MIQHYLTFIVLISIFTSTCLPISAQESNQDIADIHRVLDDLFNGMREGNGEKVAKVFTEEAKLNSVYTTKKGEYVVRSEAPANFIEAVDTPRKEVWDEKLLSIDVKIDGNLAQVWTPYEFYVDEDFQHCGVNAFHMVRTKDGWKILQLTDTRRRSSCDKANE